MELKRRKALRRKGEPVPNGATFLLPASGDNKSIVAQVRQLVVKVANPGVWETKTYQQRLRVQFAPAMKDNGKVTGSI